MSEFEEKNQTNLSNTDCFIGQVCRDGLLPLLPHQCDRTGEKKQPNPHILKNTKYLKKRLFCTIDLSDVFFRSSLCSSAMYLSSWSGLEWSENQGMGLWVVFSFKTALISSIRQMISKKRKDSVGSKSTVR